jgi:telomerase protein component 1
MVSPELLFYAILILQLALYCRHELNVRSTSHLLLAFASVHKPCRPFLQRFFAKTIFLPTDWTSVADLVQTFIPGSRDLNAGSLPAILRKCMLEKFAQFDQYQLAKHNKVKSKKDIPIGDFHQDELELEHGLDEELLKRRFSIKRLIRLLHIKDPVFHVLAILGKK